jgi:membrane protease YdiL (CAAX protease family)
VGSLIFVTGLCTMPGAFRPWRSETGRCGWVRALSVVGGLGVGVGPVLVLFPVFGLQLAPLSASTTPMVGLAVLAAGAVLALVALHLDPVEDPFATPEAPHRSLADRLAELHPRRFFLETWRRLDEEAALERAADGGAYDWKPILVLSSGAVFLAMMEYFGFQGPLRAMVTHFAPVSLEDEGFWAYVRGSHFPELLDRAWWAGWRVVGFFLLPVLVLRLVLGERVAAHGLSTKGFLDHAWIYLLAYGVVLGLVIGVSFGESFQTYYPFYRQASRSWYDFVAWEVLYAAQFFSLEFFFRGYWLKACKRAMGSHAIFVMVVPYCMIHFGKPYPETLGAILAGIALGTLALRTRSIWSGFLIHVSVAISMDVAALLQTTGLPTRWWPIV